MASHHSKSLYAIKECFACGSWTSKVVLSKGSLNDKILVPIHTLLSLFLCVVLDKVQKKEQAYEEEKYSAACRYMLSSFSVYGNCDDEMIYSFRRYYCYDILRQKKSKHPTYRSGVRELNSKCRMSLLALFRQRKDEVIQIALFPRSSPERAHIAPIPPGIVEADFDSNDDTSSDDDDFEDIEYVSLEEVNNVNQEEKEFDLDDILQIQDVILREKLLNVHRLISNIESLKFNSLQIGSRVSFSISLTPSRIVFSPNTSLSYE
ncbi:hypothetical protein Tco_0173655 [Tanacetum coccineum]